MSMVLAPSGVNTFASTLHWGPHWPEDPWYLTHQQYTLPEGQDFSADFHVFGFAWNTTNIVTYVDSPQNVVMNVEIDESFWKVGKLLV